MVHGVRRTLEALTGPDSQDLSISYQDHGYILHVSDRVLIDFDEFQRLADAGRLAAARGDDNSAAELYEQAMKLYRGDFLAGGVDEWILDQREWLRAIALRVTEQLVKHALTRAQLDDAMQYSRRTLDIDPSNEDAYRALMFVHARRGELNQVKRWHQLCTKRLRQQLDVTPAPVTDHLLRVALRGERVDLDLLSRSA
jgi:DNA-binding SARP family transcriptional activator